MSNDHYGLQARPFQLTPDPRFWFDSATHKKAMAYLGYGLAQGEGFIVVTGEIGAGKTTLVGHLMASIDPARVKAVNISTSMVDRNEMLRMVAQAFGIDPSGANKVELLSKIETQLGDWAHAGQRTLLIVDEVQNLPVESLEELRMLSNFQISGHSLLQILLLGQPEFRETVAQPELEQLRQRVIATHHLTPMAADEVGPYVAHRLRLVGWQGTPEFTAEAFAALHRYSGGIPRKVNMLASRVLLMGAVEQAALIDARIVDGAWADMQSETGMAAPAPAPVPEPYEAPAPQPEPVFVAEPAPVPMPEPVFVTEAVVAAVETPFEEDVRALDLVARVTMLEAQVEEQDAALRRVLDMLVNWVEDDRNFQQPFGALRAPAA